MTFSFPYQIQVRVEILTITTALLKQPKSKPIVGILAKSEVAQLKWVASFDTA